MNDVINMIASIALIGLAAVGTAVVAGTCWIVYMIWRIHRQFRA